MTVYHESLLDQGLATHLNRRRRPARRWQLRSGGCASNQKEMKEQIKWVFISHGDLHLAKALNTKYIMDGRQISNTWSKKPNSKKAGNTRGGSSVKDKVLSRVFSEDYDLVKRKILDPRGPTIRRWNRIFLMACLVSLFVDPIFFFLPRVKSNEYCIMNGKNLEIVLTLVRSIADIFYIIHIYLRFRTAYIAPSSRVFGRGELVIDPHKIAARYLKKFFWIDLLASLPLPQLLIWGVIPILRCGSIMENTKNGLRLILLFQYLPRLLLIFPLSSKIIKTTGVVTETAWAGAAYNLMLFLLASHGLGASWYLLSLEREEECWTYVCSSEKPMCKNAYFDCRYVNEPKRDDWLKASNLTTVCNASSGGTYPFGIFALAVVSNVTSITFTKKYSYCLWWGLQNLSSLGQGLVVSTNVGEIIFSTMIVTLGLVLFALLIGNLQTYLQSTTVRLEEWRIKRTDTEEWMHHRQLPEELKQAVRKYDQYKWVATQGVDEEALLESLPSDLRRDIKRHVCLDLVRQVPLFDKLDDRMLDAICERLKPALSTQGTFLVREGDPVNNIHFIIRGQLDSFTTQGGRTGFFNSCRIGVGDFCGEELLTWALDPRSDVILPSSTRTVKAITEVESFALGSEDLKFVASQYRKLHSKQLRHKLRVYSPLWRTWAAIFIQAAWKRYKRRKLRAEHGRDDCTAVEGLQANMGRLPPRPGSRRSSSGYGFPVGSLQKPHDPDFSCHDYVI